jgi:hypothetical protein
MNGNGAYEDEMNEIVLFESALRAAVPTVPDPRIGATLVPRLAEAAGAATLETETRPARQRPRSRFALVARVGIAVALIPLVLAGLAFAGVTVPGPARSAFDSVGINLPNQPASHENGSSHGQSSNKAKQDEETTTASPTENQGKSDAAHQHALEQHQKAQGKALGHEKGKAIGLNGSTPPGQQKDKPDKGTETGGPPSHSNAGGNSATHKTTHTSPEHTTPGNNGNGHSK